jgi:putative Holliday junction resolvase
MGRIMALDVGQKRVGVAITDEQKIIATGLDTIPTQEIFVFLEQYLASEEVETIVIGDPRQKDNSQSPSARFIEPLVNKINKKYPDLKVERYDERYTSKLAFRTMIESGISKKNRQNKSLIDKISATIILQSYMEFQINQRK